MTKSLQKTFIGDKTANILKSVYVTFCKLLKEETRNESEQQEAFISAHSIQTSQTKRTTLIQ